MKYIKYFCFCFLVLNGSIFAAGKNEKLSAHECYSYANKNFEKRNWQNVVYYCKKIIQQYPQSSFTKDAIFYLGVAYFNLEDYELSNRYFTRYLKDDLNPKYFEETMHYKFYIAQAFQKGSRKRLFVSRGPKIVEAYEDALAIFEEIIASMPTHDLAAKALFAKGEILFKETEYKDSVAAFEQVIEKFEKHELAVKSFIEIGKVYLKQTTYKQQDQNILDLAELNLKKFKERYPLETEMIQILNDIVLQIREKFAMGFYEVGHFYENIKKNEAALIYYTKIVNSFPETKSSQLAKERIDKLNEK